MNIYKYAIIELGVVKNVAVAEEEVGVAEGWVKLPEDTLDFFQKMLEFWQIGEF